jgi:hypothetical protein
MPPCPARCRSPNTSRLRNFALALPLLLLLGFLVGKASPRDHTSAVAAQGAPDKYILAQDAPNIPAAIRYDQAITNAQVGAIFQANSPPRALLVSRQLIEAISHPTAGFTGADGTADYYALMTVLWNGHVLAGIGSTSALIASRLGLDDAPTPFDPWRRRIVTLPEDANVLLAATVLRFAPDSAWSQYRVESDAWGPVRPSADSWFGIGSGTTPPYEMVDQFVDRALQPIPPSGSECAPTSSQMVSLGPIVVAKFEAAKLAFNCNPTFNPSPPTWCEKYNGAPLCCSAGSIIHTATPWTWINCLSADGTEPGGDFSRYFWLCEKVESAGTTTRKCAYSVDPKTGALPCVRWDGDLNHEPTYPPSDDFSCGGVPEEGRPAAEPHFLFSMYADLAGWSGVRIGQNGLQPALNNWEPHSSILHADPAPVNYTVGIQGAPPYGYGELQFSSQVVNGSQLTVDHAPGKPEVSWLYTYPRTLQQDHLPDLTPAYLCSTQSDDPTYWPPGYPANGKYHTCAPWDRPYECTPYQFHSDSQGAKSNLFRQGMVWTVGADTLRLRQEIDLKYVRLIFTNLNGQYPWFPIYIVDRSDCKQYVNTYDLSAVWSRCGIAQPVPPGGPAIAYPIPGPVPAIPSPWPPPTP